MRIRNAHPFHIGVMTVDENVDHTRWPCLSHPPTMSCEQAQRTALKRGVRSLVPAPEGANNVRAFPLTAKEV